MLDPPSRQVLQHSDEWLFESGSARRGIGSRVPNGADGYRKGKVLPVCLSCGKTARDWELETRTGEWTCARLVVADHLEVRNVIKLSDAHGNATRAVASVGEALHDDMPQISSYGNSMAAAKGELTPEAARAAREILGLSHDELAADLGLTPAVIRGWEDGRVRAAGRQALLLEWRAASRLYEDAIATSGLPTCATAQTLLGSISDASPGSNQSNKKSEQSTKAVEQFLKALEQHATTCQTCQAREDFARTLPPLPEFPLGTGEGILVGISTRIERLPPWLRPAAWGALLVGGLVLVRMAFAMLARGPSWNLLGNAVVACIVGGYLGAIGGLVYRVVRPRTRNWGRIGDYVTGVACIWGYAVALMLPAAFFSSDPSFRQPGLWITVAAVGLLAGSLIGHFWFREGAT